MPRSAKEANNPILLKVQSLQLSFRPAGVSLGGGGGGPRPPLAPPCVRPCTVKGRNHKLISKLSEKCLYRIQVSLLDYNRSTQL